MKTLPLLILFILFYNPIVAQNDTIPFQKLDTVLLKATRVTAIQERLPASVAVYKADATSVSRQQTALQEYLFNMPGVFTQNANNFAQDLRISIRGFGARSAFGIRGIKLIVDGIPETTPDGQGQLDNLNLGIIDRIEVIKGPSASLYGNASGGVIAIETLNFKNDQPFTQIKTALGAFGFQQVQATTAIGNSKNNAVIHGTYASADGYRNQSSFEQYNFNAKSNFRISENLKLTGILNYSNSPLAHDAGGLTLDEVVSNRRQARQRNIDFQTEEAIQQLKLGTHIHWKMPGRWSLENYQFYTYRDFKGSLPFEFGGIVGINRNYLGHGININHKGQHNTFKAGYDLGVQNDQRSRFRNLEGVQGDITLNQQERFTAIGIYALDHFKTGPWLLTAGFRYDYNQIRIVDRLTENGDDSGSIVLHTVNPSLGISYEWLQQQRLYISFATSFETPTLSELSADPEDSQGFNENLEAQKAINIEVGFKGRGFSGFYYQLALFLIDTQDDLVPFELEAFPDRTFFRNAGRSRRQGVEIEAQYAFAKAWKATASYTYSDFEYRDFVLPAGNFSGNILPGIPQSTLSAHLQYGTKKGFHAALQANFIGRLYADDGNTTAIPGYELLNFRTGYTLHFKKLQVQPYLGLNNVLDTGYNDNIRINAFGNRYFEPAPGIHGYGGVEVRF